MKFKQILPLIIFIQCTLVMTPVEADKHKKAADLTLLKGHWAGQLQYRDYGSDRDVAIPMEVTINLSPDNQFIISDIAYTDPGYKVYAHVVTRFDHEKEKVHEYYFSKGSMTENSYDIDWMQHSEDKWIIEYSKQGQDGGKKADIKIRKTISADTYVSQQWVQYEAEEAFIRNQTLLEKTQ
ncbi:hypothetical protein [Marinicella sp. W31]|uniref:hypothetical protein n=1 Tax=Marinicella sp. W31 TaxID=3023713 RepID=UPI00375844EA